MMYYEQQIMLSPNFGGIPTHTRRSPSAWASLDSDRAYVLHVTQPDPYYPPLKLQHQ